MKSIKTIVLSGYGTNSDIETAHTARLAGSDIVDNIHFSELIKGTLSINDYHFLIFPGGFLDGDDLGAAQTATIRWRYLKTAQNISLLDELKKFLSDGKIILGICNGFQLLVKLGILPAINSTYFERQVSLGHNDSARFEDRWVFLKPNKNSPCIFTKDLPIMQMPIRHGEGKLIAKNQEYLDKLNSNNHIAFQYIDSENGEATLKYPQNPNGSPLGIAGLTDPSGRVLGLMPHPEAFHHVTNHPQWTRGEISAPGTMLFVNGIRYLRENL